jgi:uncharacterized membrane protein HdeD (DUF308 family)
MTSTHASFAQNGGPLLNALAQNWWLFLFRGIAAIALGALAFFWPGVTLVALTILWGAYAFVDGGMALGASFAGPGPTSARWWLAIVGAAGIVLGILAFVWPTLTAVALMWFVALWAIIVGIMQIIGAVRLREEIENERLLVLSGVLAMIFGGLVILQPAVGVAAIAFAIGVFAVAAGVTYVAFAFRLRRHTLS